MNIIFTPVSWELLNDWIQNDRKIAKRIDALRIWLSFRVSVIMMIDSIRLRGR